MLISQLLSSVNMLFSKTGSFITPFTQKLLSATRLFTGVVFQYDYLSRLRLALTRMQNFFYEKPVSLFDSIFIESSINVP